MADDSILDVSDTERITELLSTYESEGIIGDVNGDGYININDVTAIQTHIANIMTLTSDQLAVADANGDGVVDINDATHLQKYLAEFNVALGKQS